MNTPNDSLPAQGIVAILHDPLTLVVAAPVATALLGGLGWLIKRRLDRGRAGRVATIERQHKGVNVAGDVHQSGGVNVAAHGGTVTIHSAPSPREFAEAQQRVARQHALEVERVTRDLEACIAVILAELRAFAGGDAPSNVFGRVDSTLDEWTGLAPRLTVLDDPHQVEDVTHFFEDLRYHFQTLRPEGPPKISRALELIRHAESLIGVHTPMGVIRYPWLGLEWVLTDQFRLNYQTVMADQCSPDFIRSAVQGPYCANCKHDVVSIFDHPGGTSECPHCPTTFDLERLRDQFKGRVPKLEELRRAVFSRAQAAARRGELYPD
jgi:hypothetical protein